MTKHIIPQLRPELVARPRLFARLDTAMHAPLTIVAAPAGFGKTTLLAAWLASAERRTQNGEPVGSGSNALAVRFGWLSLDVGDNDPVRLLRGLIVALQQAAPQIGTAILPVLQQRQRRDLDAVLHSLISELAERAQPVVLILDDTHLLTDPAATGLLAALVEQQPPTLRLILAGRADPPLPLARLRACGQLHEIRAADLRFSLDETTALLRAFTGIPLTIEQAASLCARTEGWAAGLQLAALTLQGAARPAERIAAFNGTHRFVLDYFTDEVLAQQPPLLQQFLLLTSILDRFSAELCAALLVDDQAMTIVEVRQQLDRVAKAHLFLVPLDDAHCWYRYHHLFADLLRHQGRQRFPERIPLLHERAARWYAANGLIDEAVQHALAAGAAELAVELIEQTGRSRLMQGELATVQRWLATLPPALVDARPALLLLQAWTLVWDYQPAALAALLRQLPTAIPDALAAETAALHAFVARSQDDWPRALRLSEQALQAARDNPFLAGFLYAGLGDIYWLTEQAAQAMDCHRCALECACQSGDLVQLVDATHSLAQFEILQGRLTAAEAVYAYGTTRLAAHGALAAPFTHLFALGQASIHYERYALATARQAAEDGLAQVARCGLSIYEPFVQAELARIAAAQGDSAAAQQALLAMRQGAQRMIARSGGQVPTWVGILRLRDVEITLALGDLPTAARWAIDHWVAPGPAESVATIVQQFALAQVCVACLAQPAVLAPLAEHAGASIPTLAEALIASCLPRFSAWGLEALVLELQTLAAVLHASQGDTEAAQLALREALRRAAPEGFVRPFVRRGLAMNTLLTAALAQRHGRSLTGEERTFAVRVHRCFPADMTPDVRDLVSIPLDRRLAEALSAREREVLLLLAAGMSHREIAATLTIAPDTARTHIKNIYGKLQVQNRVQAIARARALELVPV